MRLACGNVARRAAAMLPLRGACVAQVIALALAACTPTYALAIVPSVSAISVNNGPQAGGTAVLLSGENFRSGEEVRFGASPASAVRVLSPTSILASSPAGAGTVDVHVVDHASSSASTPHDQFAYDPPPAASWLGLNGNSSTYLGPIDTFARRGVVYDRSGPIEFLAGELAEQGGVATPGGRALDLDFAAGMVPVVTIEYSGYHGDYRPDQRFPSEAGGSSSLADYVRGFVASAVSIRAAHPGQTVLFEPINEPWGYTTPRFDGARYADVIAALLPAASAAGIPLNAIYVGATGHRWIEQMYAAQPQLEREVQGWYLHPYGPPHGSHDEDSAGIQSLPAVQAEMTSGQNNVIVSEVGYCDSDVNGGRSCGGLDTSSGSGAAQDLGEMLVNALAYHEQGWLRALLVYSRNDGGWAMQTAGGTLTGQGSVLLSFAAAMQPSVATAAASEEHCIPPLAGAIVAGARLFISNGLECGERRRVLLSRPQV